MAYITNYQYYTNGGVIPTDLNHGEYQYVSLSDIIKNFMLMYVGNDKLVNNVDRYVLFPLTENRQPMSATAYLQDNNLDILFDVEGEIVTGDSRLDILRQQKTLYTGGGIYSGCQGYNHNGDWYFGYRMGGRFGLDTSEANINPRFFINKAAGVIDFSSGIQNRHIVLEYVSDGMENGDDSKITINKMAEDYIYNYIKWALLNNKTGVQEYVINRARKEKTATLRNAKIRLSNLHPSRLLMSLRGKDKWIK